MKKRKFIVPAIAIIAAALLLEGFILKYVNDRNADRTSKVLLDRVITVLDKNNESEEALIKSLKDDYIVRAKAVLILSMRNQRWNTMSTSYRRLRR